MIVPISAINTLDSFWMNEDITLWDRAKKYDDNKIITADNEHWVLPVDAKIKTIVFHGSANGTVNFVVVRGNR